MQSYPDQLYDLREHCARLSRLLNEEEVEDCLFSIPNKSTTGYDEDLNWSNASEWLYIAASIQNISINTVYFDSSLLFCGNALDYEVARSKLLSELTESLTIFNFVWGSFETIAKLIDPPKVPKMIKPGASSIIDNALFLLKDQYNALGGVPFYMDVLAEFREILGKVPYYKGLSNELRLQPHIDISGVGLHVVRKIRNKFAHGTMSAPIPEEWTEVKPLDAYLVDLSTRILLLTCQMLLLVYTKQEDFLLDYYFDPFMGRHKQKQSFHHLLRTIHVNFQYHPKQMKLLLE